MVANDVAMPKVMKKTLSEGQRWQAVAAREFAALRKCVTLTSFQQGLNLNDGQATLQSQ